MTSEELNILLEPEVRRAIDLNIGRNPLDVALDTHLPHPREVATQVKYLQRARHKLPRLYEARAIIPQRAFEQSSSEQVAATKRLSGKRLLDLTCGLGVDSMVLAERFEKVVAIERNEVLAEVVRENLRRMQIDNVEVVTASAEEFVAQTKERFDWIYVDPDRRTAEGRRVVRLEDCSPNVIQMREELSRVADRIAIKCSPLFDVEQAFRLFGRCGVEVISMGGECKEVVIYADGREPSLAAEAVGEGRVEVLREKMEQQPLPERFAAEQYGFLIVPDVALQKARLVRQTLSAVADVWSENSFAFARVEPADVLGRVEHIEQIKPFDTKALKREFKGCGVDILVRDFPLSVEEVRRRCSMRSGAQRRLALTRIEGKCYTIYIK